jgi:hypothetical protein
MANALSSETDLHAAANAQRVTAIAPKAKVHVRLASLTTVAHATRRRVHRVTLTRLAHHDVMMTTSSPAPTRTWAPKAA